MLNLNQKPDAVGAGSNMSLKVVFVSWCMRVTQWLNQMRKVDFVAPLIFRLFLAPIFITFGLNKGMHFESTVQWFGNADWGLGLPFPMVLAGLAIGAEVIGGFLLLFGFLTRLIVVPLMITMIVAIFTAHIENGWHAIAPSDPATNIASITQHIGFPGAQESLENSEEVRERLSRARSILREHGNYDYLTEKGSIVVLNNGIEFAFIYFAMLLSLFFTGAGAVSLDYLMVRKSLLQ